MCKMGGKSYFCDYCSCYMKNDINVRKTHNSGLAHTIAKANYLRHIEDPRKVLAIESAKVPCSRYLKSYCKFELFCQNSHYSQAQLEELRNICSKMEQREQNRKSNGVKTLLDQLLPWNMKSTKQRKFKKLKKLPPSLRPINFKKLRNDTCVGWG